MLLPLFSGLLCSSIVFIIRLSNTTFNKNIMTNTYIILAFQRFHKHNLTSLLIIHPRAEPYRTEHSSSRFGSAHIFSNHTLSSASIEILNSIRLVLENFERESDSTRKCTIRFDSAWRCTIW